MDAHDRGRRTRKHVLSCPASLEELTGAGAGHTDRCTLCVAPGPIIRGRVYSCFVNSMDVCVCTSCSRGTGAAGYRDFFGGAWTSVVNRRESGTGIVQIWLRIMMILIEMSQYVELMSPSVCADGSASGRQRQRQRQGQQLLVVILI